jgi:hypothetical protein
VTSAAGATCSRRWRTGGRACAWIDETPPFAFAFAFAFVLMLVEGMATLSEDPAELLRWATVIGGRYMGAERAEEFGRRNGAPGELLVLLTPTKVIAMRGVAD